jgi:hypothetical protein
MTDQHKLYLAIGVPIVVNASVLVAVLLIFSGALIKRLDDLHMEMRQHFDALNRRFDEVRLKRL